MPIAFPAARRRRLLQGILGVLLTVGLGAVLASADKTDAAESFASLAQFTENPVPADGVESVIRFPSVPSGEPQGLGEYPMPQGMPPGGAWPDQPEMAPHQRLFQMLTHPGQCCQCMRLPLVRESWRYRPLSAGWFMGGMVGSPLIDDWVGLSHGFFAGYRLGWDFDHYWGVETRFSFGSVALYDSPRAIEASHTAQRINLDGRRDADVLLWDLNMLYYPWGDEVWRPYLMAGLGTARVDFEDKLTERYNSAVFAMPLGVGVKYRCNNWLALRFELADNIAFGTHSNLQTQHNLSITGGMEVRFGGSRTAYWPYNPGRSYW